MKCSPQEFVSDLKNPARPTFLFGVTPPKQGTTEEKARETAKKFTSRSAVLANDGFLIYDIQEEQGRTEAERPFPFRKTLDPAWFGSLFPEYSGKQCIIYKCVVENDKETFENWLKKAINDYGHMSFNAVGAPTSKISFSGLTLKDASCILKSHNNVNFGCVCIAERHVAKNEAQIMCNKMDWGAEWFISQGIYSATSIIRLIQDYGCLCRDRGIAPKKLILTFAPCGRTKTMEFIKWLGMTVPPQVEERIFSSPNPAEESILVLCETLNEILQNTSGTGVPLGINVESLSIYKEEIDAAHVLFQRLQAILLNHRGSPWSVKWFLVQESKLFHAVERQNTGGEQSAQLIKVQDDSRAFEKGLLISTTVLSLLTTALLIVTAFRKYK